MKLKIIGIDNSGSLDDECVKLEAMEDCNLGDYMIADCTYVDEHEISNKARHNFFFPDWNVKKGDEILLWTHGDFNPQTTKKFGIAIHQFSWNFNEQIWNNKGDCAFLCEIADCQAFGVSAKK